MPIAITSPLTQSPPEPALAALVQLLDDAGLELWQAPEGFWAIRVKPVAAPARPPWRRRSRSAA